MEVTALVASLATACCASIGVQAEAAGLSAPNGEGLLKPSLLTRFSASGITLKLPEHLDESTWIMRKLGGTAKSMGDAVRAR